MFRMIPSDLKKLSLQELFELRQELIKRSHELSAVEKQTLEISTNEINTLSDMYISASADVQDELRTRHPQTIAEAGMVAVTLLSEYEASEGESEDLQGIFRSALRRIYAVAMPDAQREEWLGKDGNNIVPLSQAA